MKRKSMHMDSYFYQQMLTRFVNAGELPDLTLCIGDPLANYIADTMHDPNVQKTIFSNKLCERIFTDSMMQFITLCLEKARYRLQRTKSEHEKIREAYEWSLIRRNSGWRALVDMADREERADGFERGFFDHKFGERGKQCDDTEWHHFLNEWSDCLSRRLNRQTREFVKERSIPHRQLVRNNLQAIPDYIATHGTNEDEFLQGWGLMGGRWNAIEYERLARVTLLQRRYPILVEVANRMGRIPDPQGNRRIGTSFGTDCHLPTASHSDIIGVSLGREWGALLPSELAAFLDPQMENIFLKKYVSSNLTVFDSYSHQSTAARSLQMKTARSRGPMIVCCDTSGSMQGEPMQIALSLMMRLTELADRQRRDCLLIAFGSGAHPIDVLRDRTLLLRFFTQRAQGGTDARPMITLMEQIISHNPHYTGADVLWITDFRIPVPQASFLMTMERLHKEGTRFYGLQIGIADNKWKHRFDNMYQIKDAKVSPA